MTNLSDLFPAGAGKQVSFVADGAISAAGKPVILNGAGTVTPVGLGPGSGEVGTPVVFESAATEWTAAAFDSNSNKVVIAYEDVGNSSYGTAVVGTVSGTSISWGTPVIFESASVSAYGLGATFDSNSNKVVIAYSDVGNSTYGTGIVGTVSGTAISFGTAVVFNSATTYYSNVTFDSDSNKVVIAYRDGGNSYHGYGIVGTVSGTAISYGTGVVFESASAKWFGVTFDSTANKVVISYQDEDNSSYGTGVVGTVSGTAISFGSATVYASGTTSYTSACYDSANDKTVIAYRNESDGSKGTAVVGTVSGTGISFGTPVAFTTGPLRATPLANTYDVTTERAVISYSDGDDSDKGKSVFGTVSGTTISFAAAVVFESGETQYISSALDSNSNKVVIAYQDDSNSDYGTGVVYSATASNMTAANFIGISDAAILDTASGNVTIKGGIAATGLTSLTPASDYYAQGDGTISTVSTGSAVKIGKAMSATSINLEYQS